MGVPHRIARSLFMSLPRGLRRTVREIRLVILVRLGRFDSEEPEYRRLSEWLKPGDIALDVGANFGSFTLKMSKLVGDSGRVFAFEPVPQTFAMLVRALGAVDSRNVTALNVACSDTSGPITMATPDDSITGENLYQSWISTAGPSLSSVYRVRTDDLPLPKQGIKVVKIDAEGHDAAVIMGMWGLLQTCMPVLITEHPTDEIIERLKSIGYQLTKDEKSPNGVFIPR